MIRVTTKFKLEGLAEVIGELSCNITTIQQRDVVKKGVLEDECSKLLKDFFIELRARNKAEKEQKGNL